MMSQQKGQGCGHMPQILALSPFELPWSQQLSRAVRKQSIAGTVGCMIAVFAANSIEATPKAPAWWKWPRGLPHVFT